MICTEQQLWDFLLNNTPDETYSTMGDTLHYMKNGRKIARLNTQGQHYHKTLNWPDNYCEIYPENLIVRPKD